MDLSGVVPPTDIGTVLKRNNYIITYYIMYRAFLCLLMSLMSHCDTYTAVTVALSWSMQF